MTDVERRSVTLKAITRNIVSPVARPIWRRMLARIESAYVIPLQSRLSALEAERTEEAKRTEPRLSALEAGWNQHIPAFLNAVSTVGAFGHELRQQGEAIVRYDAKHAEEIKRLEEGIAHARDEVAQHDAEQAGDIRRLEEGIAHARDEVAQHDAEQAGDIRKLEEGIAHTRQEIDRRDAERGESIAQLWERLEFVRNEILFEVKYGRTLPRQVTAAVDGASIEPRVLSPTKLAAAGDHIRLNLGCGHIPLDEYLNVDARELPGVDIVTDVGSLPFQPNTVEEISSAHLLEHFPQEMLRRNLLPYWRSLLSSGGRFSAIVPDGEAMLAGAAVSTYPFEEFREVLFGAQDYDGDFHYNLFTPESLKRLVEEAGFTDVKVPVRGRRNGKCFEFQLLAIRP